MTTLDEVTNLFLNSTYGFLSFSKSSKLFHISDYLGRRQVTTLDKVTNLFLNSTYGFLSFSKSGPELPQVPVVFRYFVTYLTSFVAVDPFFRTEDPHVASRTDNGDKFLNKAPPDARP